MLNSVKLTFINNSKDVNNSDVLIFQKNHAQGEADAPVAWLVIRNCGVGDHYPFEVPMHFDVGAEDAAGNLTPMLQSYNGECFEMVKASSGAALRKSDNPGVLPSAVEVTNNLEKGAISARVYKNGKLLAQKLRMAPAQKAFFTFEPQIFVTPVSQVTEGEPLSQAIVALGDKINLQGVMSADLVMIGGGAGTGAIPFAFRLENIVGA